MAALLDTPSRVLKRVQQYEEMELPSLPSFQRDDLDLSEDYDTSQNSASDKSMAPVNLNESETGYYSTPHVARGISSSPPSTVTTTRTETTVKPSPSSPTTGSTPIPASRSHIHNGKLQGLRDSFPVHYVPDHFSDTSGAIDGAETLHAYEDYSSFPSGRLHPPSFGGDLTESIGDDLASSAVATPYRGSSVHLSTAAGSPRWPVEDTPKPLQDARVPSLSRSEVSATDNEATTPEGREGLQLPATRGDMSDISADESKHDPPFTLSREPRISSPSSSPASITSTAATPVAIRYMDHPSTAARAAATPFGATAPLRDVTPVFRNQRTTTAGIASPSINYTNSPRAPLNDVARRKSHVLSVLASASLPSRVRSRPTPLRREQRSASPQANTVNESLDFVEWRPRKDVDGGSTDVLDDSLSQDISALSLATSNDLTSDRSAISAPFRRGNTSVPDILLANGGAASGSNLRLENRPDAVRIHKHLNMMNQQLLDTNADLAREAEDWRNECRRLIDIMREAGIEVAEQGLVGDLDSADTEVAHSSATESLSATATSSGHQVIEQLQDALRDKDNLAARLQLDVQEKDAQLSTLRLQGNTSGAEVDRRSPTSSPGQPSDVDHEVLRLQNDYARKTEEHARQFTEICADFEHQVQDLKRELGAARDEASVLRAQLGVMETSNPQEDDLRGQIAMLEDNLARVRKEAHAASEEVAATQGQLCEARASEKAILGQLATAQQERTLATSRAEELHQRLLAAESQVTAYTHQFENAEARLSSCEDEKTALQEENAELARRINNIEGCAASEQVLVAELRNTVQELTATSETREAEILASKKRITKLESQLLDAQSAQSNTQVELESIKNQLSIARLEILQADGTPPPNTAAPSSLVAALEERLDEAHREIGRLKAERDAMPARVTALDARDARIRALETEKETLLERLKAREISSPARWANSMRTSTPVVHKAISALRSPRTPGPLKELSWLQTTIDDSNESLLRAQLEHLQQELDVANSQLDKNFDRLEEAGLGAVHLAELLAEANEKIAQYEEERIALARINKQSEESLHVGRSKNEQLERALETVHHQLSTLRENMSADKERLQEDNRRLRLQVSDMRLKYDEQIELLAVESARAQADAEDEIAEATEKVDSIRREREALAIQLGDKEVLVEKLQREVATHRSSIDEMSRKLTDLREDLAAADRDHEQVLSLQAAMGEKQSSLVFAQQESERLRNQLRRRCEELAGAEREVDALKEERARVTGELAQFRQDLAVQRSECVSFGTALELARQESRGAQTAHAHQLAISEERLQTQQSDLKRAIQHAKQFQQQHASLQRDLERYESQVQTAGEQRHKLKSQARRLSAQIEYLKAVYARENTFRNALALQKKFLLLLVGGMSLNEQATLRAIASMGYEVAAPARPKRTLKAVSLAVLSFIRARRMAQQWEGTRMKRNAAVVVRSST